MSILADWKTDKNIKKSSLSEEIKCFVKTQCGQHSIRVLAKLLSVPKTTLHDWVTTEKLFPFKKQTKVLCHFCELLNSDCKNLDLIAQKSFVQKPPGQRELTEESKDFVRNQCGNHSINKMSKVMTVPKTTLYDWINTEKLYPFEKKTDGLCHFYELDKKACNTIGKVKDVKKFCELMTKSTKPNSTEPNTTEPNTTEQNTAKPFSTEPNQTEPNPTETNPTETDPTELNQTETKSTVPGRYLGIKSGEKCERYISIVHEGKITLKCTVCGKSFSHIESIKSHISSTHVEKKLLKFETVPAPPSRLQRKSRCKICKQVFLSKSEMKSHNIEVHDGKKPQCSICSSTFKTEWLLGRHTVVAHGKKKKKVKCKLCDTVFKERKDYNEHILSVHDGKKPFPCTKCTSSFLEKSQLKIHILSVHEGIKPHKCNVCNERFGTSVQLNNHFKRVHEGEKNSLCTICGASFYEKSKLRIHVETVHEKKKPYKCSTCDGDFSQSQALRNHIIAVHEKKKPHLCSLCGMSFADKSNLTNHVRGVHRGIKRKMKT